MATWYTVACSVEAMKGLEDIVKGVSGFVKYWDNLCNADVTGEYRRRYEHLVKYWHGGERSVDGTVTYLSYVEGWFLANHTCSSKSSGSIR